jgi:hypothetical protein
LYAGSHSVVPEFHSNFYGQSLFVTEEKLLYHQIEPGANHYHFEVVVAIFVARCHF